MDLFSAVRVVVGSLNASLRVSPWILEALGRKRYT